MNEPFITSRTWREIKAIALREGVEPQRLLRRLLNHSVERELLRVKPRLEAAKVERAKAA
jgi:hypothetical protein